MLLMTAGSLYAVLVPLFLASLCPQKGATTSVRNTTWSCGCNPRVYNVAKIVLNHPVATWATSAASIDGALSDCQSGDPTATLIDSTTLDLECIKAYRAQLISEFPSIAGLSNTNLWLAKKNGQCVQFIGASNTIRTAACNSADRSLYFCTRPIDISVACATPCIKNMDYFTVGCSSFPCTTSSYMVYCKAGYTASATAGSVTCGSDGIWKGLTCNAIPCTTPTPVNGVVTTPISKTFGSTATVTCNTGYTKNGATVQLTCSVVSPSNTGLWSGAVCEAVDCGVPSIANANSYGTSCQGQCTTYQSRMTVSCSRGYTAVGVSGTLTCGSDGQWTGFSCNAVPCTTPTPVNGVVTTPISKTFGSTATVTCNTGYTKNGATVQITCNVLSPSNTGLWSGQFCAAVDCGVPAIANANSYGTSCQSQCTTYQSRMTVSCRHGYTAAGASGTLTCGSDGQWTGFSCNALTCGAPPTRTNGVLGTPTTTVFGGTVNVVCNTGYTKNGAILQLACGSGATATVGSWSGPTCAGVSCGQPQAPNQGTLGSVTSMDFGSSISVTCNDGYTANAATPMLRCGVHNATLGLWSTIDCLFINPPLLDVKAERTRVTANITAVRSNWTVPTYCAIISAVPDPDRVWTATLPNHTDCSAISMKDFADLEIYTNYVVSTYIRLANGDSSGRTTRIVRTLEDKPSAAPSSLAVSSKTNTTLTLTWSAPPLRNQSGVITNYTLRYNSTGPVIDTGFMFTTSTNATTTVLASLYSFFGYSISIAASTSVGRGPFSAAPVTVKTDPSVPAVSPKILRIVSLSNSSVQVTWELIGPVLSNGIPSGYTVRHRATSLPGTSYSNCVVSADTDTLVITGLQIYTNYSVSVRATSHVGPGPYSPDSIVKTDEGIPMIVGGVAVYMSATNQMAFANVSWTRLNSTRGPILHYRISYGLVRDKLSSTAVASPDHSSISISGLNAETSYYFAVQGRTHIGLGPLSNVLYSGGTALLPDSPTDVAVQIKGAIATVSWMYGGNVIDGFQIYAFYRKVMTARRARSVRVPDDFGFLNVTVKMDKRTAILTPLLPSTSYAFDVLAVRSYDGKELSSSFTTDFTNLQYSRNFVNGRTTSGHTFSTISVVGTVLGIFLGGTLVGIIALVLFRRIRPVHKATKPSSDIEPSGVILEDRTSSDTCTSTAKGRAGIRYIDSPGGSEQKDAPDLPPSKQRYLDNNAFMATKSAPLTDNAAYGSLPAIPVYEAPSQDAFLPAQGDYSEATYGEIYDPEPPADLTAAQVVAQHVVLY